MKRIIFSIFLVGIFCFLWGCSSEKLSADKLRDIPFTVLDEDQIPEKLEDMIAKKEDKFFKYTYVDQGELFIAVGYGEQPTSGYSIKVKELYETKNAIYIHTNLIGPTKEEKIVERVSYPYIVVKLEHVDKNVVFE